MKVKSYDEVLNLIEEMQSNLESLKSDIKEIRLCEKRSSAPHKRSEPGDGEYYYILNLDTNRIYSRLRWCNDPADIVRFEYGAIYRTPVDAAFAAERMKVLTEMQEWAGSWDSPYTIGCNWSHPARDITIVDRQAPIHYGEIRFATHDDAAHCIDTVGEDRIRKYYFMIPTNEEV